MIEAAGQDGQKMAFYFQIDRVVVAEPRMLGHH
jgi:hypothetical protein